MFSTTTIVVDAPTSQDQLRHELEFGSLPRDPSLDPTSAISPPPRMVHSLSSTQASVSTMDVEPDSPMSRFLSTPVSPLPTNTPSKTRAMRERKAAAPSRSTSSSPKILEDTKTRMRDTSSSPSPAAKRKKFSSRQTTGRIDHYSPPPRSRLARPPRELFPVHETGRNLSCKEERCSRSQSVLLKKDEYIVKYSEDVEKEAPKKKYPDLRSIILPQGDEAICYNCGAKGHWFTDCLLGCGRCGREGHKTMLCDHLGKGKFLKQEDIEE